jgi:alkanesulfonate monooxygenase SsuD/methylene tetrahydromethanopterin reductase-like flavin-dependent oxidoreductase (luciferase family)
MRDGGGRLQLSVYLPTWAYATGAPVPWPELRAMARQAEAVGVDAVFVPDHVGGPASEFWEAWTLLGALADATDRVAIGPLVTPFALRHPVLVAWMARTVDAMSGGRLILGLGAGAAVDRAWSIPGIPTARLFSRFEEGLRIVAPLLREGRVDFQGRAFAAHQATLSPPGPRPNGPPIWVGVRGPRMMRLAARWADAVNFNPPGFYVASPEDLTGPFAALEAACREVGRDPTTVGRTAMAVVSFAGAGADLTGGRARALRGAAAEVAERLHALHRAGVEHLFCALDTAPTAGPMPPVPLTDAAGLEQFGRVIDALRRIEDGADG